MISQRLRLALILVAAIVAVVVAAVFVTVKIVGRPHDGSFEVSFAEKAAVTARFVGGSADRARAAGLTLGEPPPGAQIDAGATASIRRVLDGQGDALPVAVVDDPDGPRRRLAFALPGGAEWVYLAYPSPPSPWRLLVAYLVLVVAGTTAIALFAADRITGPMRLLEEALAAVRPDGTLAPVPERGAPEVKATARALNALSLRLKAAMESRMRLVAAAGHDLRTPMTRLRLRAEFLPEGEREIWLRDLEELDRIADSAIRLVREEANEAPLQPLGLGGLAAEVVGELCDIGLPAAFEPGAEVAAPVQRLAMKRALRNIVENAARHGGGASVSVSREAEAALIVVEDEGPGIPEALLSRVFEPFFRVDAGRRKTHAGAGLGLAIAREIVERHGGRLSIRNREGAGLRQEIRLPLAR